MISEHTFTFPGHVILEQLGETHRSSVYRARRTGEERTVIIKVFRLKEPSFAEITRFRREYELLRNIDLDGIVKPVAFTDHEGIPAIILEDFGGVSLKEIIKEGLGIEEFLRLAIRLSEILGELHRRDISHRDIKPHNILLNRQTDTLKITDFGISEKSEQVYGDMAEEPDTIEGTLAYISPEQTGRVNLGVDYRTDLYSLGVTFYEMLTGELPFTSRDPMEIIHGHIARMPVPPCHVKQSIPEPVSDIVMRLLAKSPSERYQNGLGLAADLRECLVRLERTGTIEPFALGTRDICPRFIISGQLVGRDEPLLRLQRAFGRVGAGSAEAVFVTGEPGVGKSALVDEIHRVVMEKRGGFAAGKFDQFHRNVPYSAIKQAFQSLARQLLSENDERLNLWKTRLEKALGQNGKIVTDIIPEIGSIMGPQPEAPELGPDETRNRFNLTFKHFVRVFADEHHPLVLFLDDLQWADTASCALIQTIVTDRDLGYFLFIGSYRDAETPDHHPMTLVRNVMEFSGVPMDTIRLTPLDPDDVNLLISSMIRCEPERSMPLARAIHEKTKGTPFFINQFLRTLHDKGLLNLDVSKGWTWDIDRIRTLPDTDNVVQLMADKLNDLPPEHLDIIQLCACIGNRFDLETLCTVSNQSMDTVFSIFDRLVQQGLIAGAGDGYRFYHNRIQEAAYSQIYPTERERIHYRIGNLDLDRTPPEQVENRVFYICDQLNHACRLMATRTERTILAELNLKAGIKAKESTAYAAAVNYLATGRSLLPDTAWRTDYALAYGLYTELMECQYLHRNFDEAEKLFSIIIENAASRMDKARAYRIMIALYTSMRSPREAVELGLKALTIFGIRISPQVGMASVAAELIKTRHLMNRIGIDRIEDLPIVDDRELDSYFQIFFAMGTPAYYINPNLFAMLVLKGVGLSFKQGGIMPCGSLALVALGTIIQAALGDYVMGSHLGEMALRLNQRFDDRRTAGMVHHTFAFFIQHWKRHARHNLDVFRKVYDLSMNTGDFIYAGHSVNAATDCRLMIGTPLDEILTENLRHTDLMGMVKDPFIGARHQENTQFILSLKGLTNNRFSLSGPDFNEEEHMERLRRDMNHFGLCYTLLYLLKLNYLGGRFEEARKLAKDLGRHNKVLVGTLLSADFYHWYSLTLTALLREKHRNNLVHMTIIRKNQKKMKKWASLCPDNFQHRHDLIAAEIMAVKGQFKEAITLYHQSIASARSGGFLHDEAIACERLSLFLMENGGKEEADVLLKRAFRSYESWGATLKMEDILKSRGDLVLFGGKQSVETGGTTSSGSRMNNLDFTTVMKVSQLISSEIKLDRLLNQAMHLSIANAGAQRGYLILDSEGTLAIQASENVETGEKQVLQALPIEKCDGLSPAIVNYVYHSGEPLVLENAVKSGPFTGDPHVAGKNCKSILCMPMMNKDRLTCILYMENSLSAGVFTADRLEILKVISAQVAISLQNAQLVEDLTTEIAVRKKTEEALRTSEERFRNILEEMQDAYCEVNLKGTITFVNPFVLTLTGYDASELMGGSITQHLVTEGLITLEEYYQEIFLTSLPGKPLNCTLLNKNGQKTCLEIVASPMRDKSGNIIGYRNVGRDVTEREKLQKDLMESTRQVQSARSATILGLAKLAEYRDEETGAHIERIREYTRVLAKELSTKQEYRDYITPDYIEDIYNSAILHDIGKVGVPDAILLKPGRLTTEEFEIIKKHSTLGGNALRDVEARIDGQTFLTLSKEIAYHHHEKWDGSGYPNGLRGTEIPLSARIVALADVYDALTTRRSYKDAFSHQKAREIIVNDRGTHFAPDVVDAFLAHEEEFRCIREELFGE